jgi:hypothetical protein
MSKKLNIVGNRYGMLEVLSYVGKDKHSKTLWMCRCDCGKMTEVIGSNLQKGNSNSCGCARKDSITKHGGSRNRSYYTWRGMMRRCYNLNDKAYIKYGEAGINVCKEWHDYTNFVEDMGEPSEGESLDRINPYGDYEKSNCRWADAKTQSRNIRVRPNNKSGYTGVYEIKTGKWKAQVTLNGTTITSKVLSNLEDAIAARKELERIHWNI